MNKKFILLTMVLCLSVMFVGCSNQMSDEEFEEFENKIHQDMNSVILIITSGLSESDDWDSRSKIVDNLKVYNNSISKELEEVENHIPKNKQDKFENVYSKVSTDTVLLMSYIVNADYGENEKENIIEILNRWANITNYIDDINIEPISENSELFEEIVEKNKQSEGNNSFENPLKIEDEKLVFEDEYMYFSGFIKNTGDKTYTYVKVKVIYYDNSDNVIDTDWTYAVSSEGIAPNERKRFEIVSKYTGEITQGSLSILDYQ